MALDSRIKRFHPGENLKADDLNTIGNAASRALTADFSQTTTGSLARRMRRFWGGSAGAGLDMTNIDFGYVIADSVLRTVNINAGVFRISQQHFSVTGTTGLVASTSPSYCYLEYPRDGTPVIMPLTNDLNATIPDTTAYRHLLYTFTISALGVLEEPSIHNLGGVFVGAYWA